MSPTSYTPTPSQAEVLLSFRPRLLAARAESPYRRAAVAQQFMNALHDTGFVVADDFLPWKDAWEWYAQLPARMEAADLRAIQLTFTFEALFDFEFEGRFMAFAYSPVADGLLRRVAALYGLPLDADPDATNVNDAAARAAVTSDPLLGFPYVQGHFEG